MCGRSLLSPVAGECVSERAREGGREVGRGGQHGGLQASRAPRRGCRVYYETIGYDDKDDEDDDDAPRDCPSRCGRVAWWGGCHVWVATNEEGFRGGWYAAQVVALKRRVARGTGEEGVVAILTGGIVGKPLKIMRPAWKAETATAGGGSSGRVWAVGDHVDAFVDDGWWEGRVVELGKEGPDQKHQVFFFGESDMQAVKPSDLRVSRVCVDGHWVLWTDLMAFMEGGGGEGAADDDNDREAQRRSQRARKGSASHDAADEGAMHKAEGRARGEGASEGGRGSVAAGPTRSSGSVGGMSSGLTLKAHGTSKSKSKSASDLAAREEESGEGEEEEQEQEEEKGQNGKGAGAAAGSRGRGSSKAGGGQKNGVGARAAKGKGKGAAAAAGGRAGRGGHELEAAGGRGTEEVRRTRRGAEAGHLAASGENKAGEGLSLEEEEEGKVEEVEAIPALLSGGEEATDDAETKKEVRGWAIKVWGKAAKEAPVISY
eukprot:jgi/Mesen1/419/ME000100S10654